MDGTMNLMMKMLITVNSIQLFETDRNLILGPLKLILFMIV